MSSKFCIMILSRLSLFVFLVQLLFMMLLSGPYAAQAERLGELDPTDVGSGDKPVETEGECSKPCLCTLQQAYCDNQAMTRPPKSLPKDVITLSMHNNHVRKLFRKHFEGLHHLKHIILKGNRISMIEPTAFKDMYLLRALSLTDNILRRLSSQTFRSLSNLQVLSIRDNKLNNVEKLFYHCVSLKLLNLSSNRIKQITEKTFKRNSQMSILDLNNNRIKLIEKDSFKTMPLLKYLVLRDNPLKTVELDFGLNFHLELLDFTNCGLNEMVKGLPYSVSDLRLAENRISKITKEDLKSCKRIRLLVLSNNRIQEIETDALSHLSQLYDLYLGGNRLKKLPTNLPRSLHGLYMSYNNVSNLARYELHRCPKLQQLTLAHNEVTSVDSRALRGLESLQNLDLSYNDIHIVEPMTFADNNQLRKLDLSHNPLVELGKYCFHGLEYLHILQMSSVSSNAHLMPVVFQDTKSLMYLDMSSSPSMAHHLTAHPHYISSVEDLNLMNDSLRTLPTGFAKHMPRLQMVKLGGNPWHCNISIYALTEWMRNISVAFHERHTMKCVSPLNLKGRLIAELSMEELQPPTTTKRPYVKIDLGNNIKGLNNTDMENSSSKDSREPKTHKFSTSKSEDRNNLNSIPNRSGMRQDMGAKVKRKKHRRRKSGRRHKGRRMKGSGGGNDSDRNREGHSEDDLLVGVPTTPWPIPLTEPPQHVAQQNDQ